MASARQTRWVVFSDGACSGNPGPGGWAFVALRVLPTPPLVWEDAGAEAETTNNRMEMSAVAAFLERALNWNPPGEEAPQSVSVDLLTDSTYVIQGLSAWIHGWKKKGWKRADGQPVVNRDLWEKLDALRGDPRLTLRMKYVRGHSRIAGNERADELSVALAKGLEGLPFLGTLEDYSGEAFADFVGDVDAWLELKKDWFEETGAGRSKGARAPSANPSPRSSAPVLGYLSYVGGKLVEHPDWKSCEARVKGQSGARFRKYKSQAEKQEILRAWGL